MRRMAVAAGLGILATCAASACERLPAELAHLPMSEVEVVTATGTHEFKVWVAADAQSRERGLMFVREIPARYGMLFLFEQPQFASFWMKDTPLSLDVVFIGADGTVVNVAHAVEPLSLAPIESAAPVGAVLELVAGTAARIGLRVGDGLELRVTDVRTGD